MNAERVSAFLRTLPHVLEVEQWGGLLYWLGDKAINGKTFLMMTLEPGEPHVVAFAVGPERFAELCEQEGIVPAPYFARAHWVAAERWNVLRDREWEDEFRAAYALTLAKLPARTKAILALPKAEQKRVIADRKQLLATREAAKTKSPAPPRTTP